jgi:hypothetical protein
VGRSGRWPRCSRRLYGATGRMGSGRARCHRIRGRWACHLRLCVRVGRARGASAPDAYRAASCRRRTPRRTINQSWLVAPKRATASAELESAAVRGALDALTIGAAMVSSHKVEQQERYTAGLRTAHSRSRDEHHRPSRCHGCALGCRRQIHREAGRGDL